MYTRRQQALADQPIGLRGCLPKRALFDERAEYVGDGFVQRAGLILVDEVGGVLRHAVRQLMTNDVDRDGETSEQLQRFIAIAVDHLLAVPERVVVVVLVVNGGIQAQSTPIHRVTRVDIVIEVVSRARAIIGFVHRDVGAGWVTLATHFAARQGGAVRSVVDDATLAPQCFRHLCPDPLDQLALFSQYGRDGHGLLCKGLLFWCAAGGNLIKDVWGQDAVNGMKMRTGTHRRISS